MLDREARQSATSPLFVRRSPAVHPERRDRLVGLLPGEFGGVLEASGGIDRGDHRFQLRESPALDGFADRGALRLAAILQRIDERQRRLALGQVVAEILAPIGRI